ncbi:TfoX/Sxy family protein [Polaribacter sargassicola]|uniref:TfoX/Sxy family protein n=1 Tax=Polaribacter sargassicola TaxID=2836891 RepID=UPI001F3442E3|nr:TfoX/Sxy family protein [Polaribacter sp. DS7-9]MCG1035731.1 TfoX/Sxy family protein [Polaribacter sp. DS7-9]
MASNEFLSERIAVFFTDKKVPFYEKKMFGGNCFMVDEKMCVAVMKDEIMARINPNIYLESLEKEGCKEMSFTGKAMKGYVLLSVDAYDLDKDLYYWLQLALDFNPLAKASRKRKSSKN